jgi:hypothetical protein
VPEVPYGKLLNMVDMQNRWVYRGSVTTPPCATSVYWNVLRTVYPLKQKYLDQFKKQLNRKEDLLQTGNFRVIQKLYPYHRPYILSSGDLNSTYFFNARSLKDYSGDAVPLLLFVVVIIFIFYSIY